MLDLDKIRDPKTPPYFVAEIGIAHRGNVELAKHYIRDAKSCGADAVKFQHHIVDEEMSRTHPWYETVLRCQLSHREMLELVDVAKDEGLEFICTPFSALAARELCAMGIDAMKIGSGEISNPELLETVAKEWSGPVLVSGGMHGLGEWVSAWGQIGKARTLPLYCRSLYPCEANRTGLCGFADIAPQIGWGFSMHTREIGVGIAACALGACLIEAHFGYDDALETPLAFTDVVAPSILKLPRPDAAVELDSWQFRNLVEFGKQAWAATLPLADDDTDTELRPLAVHTPYARSDIRAGQEWAGRVGWRRNGVDRLSAEHYLMPWEFDKAGRDYRRGEVLA